MQPEHNWERYPAWQDLPVQSHAVWTTLLTRVAVPPLLIDLTASNLQIDDYNPQELAARVSQDAVLAGLILAAANSAKYGLTTPITAVQRAIVHLGFVMVKACIASYQMEATFGHIRGVPGAHLRHVRHWSATSAVLAHHWAQASEQREPSRVSTLALLSLLGSLMLGLSEIKPGPEYLALPDESARLAYEQDNWGICSPVLSAALAQQWKLPETLVQDLERVGEPILLTDLPPTDAPLAVAAGALAVASQYLKDPEMNLAEFLDTPGNSRLRSNLDAMGLSAPLLQIWVTARLQRDLSAAGADY